MIIANPMALRDATDADLLQTYNKLTGNKLKKFSSRAVGERLVEMALLAAKDRAGHKGVPRGAEPDPLDGCVEEDCDHPVGVCSCMAAVLTKTPVVAKPPVLPCAGAILSVKATFAGTSQPRAGSQRSAVLAAIQKAPNATITMLALEAVVGFSCRGHAQKLLAKQHIMVVSRHS